MNLENGGNEEMAKYKHTKTTTEKIQIDGILNSTSMTVDIDGEETSIKKELSMFDGKNISLTFVEKIDEEV